MSVVAQTSSERVVNDNSGGMGNRNRRVSEQSPLNSSRPSSEQSAKFKLSVEPVPASRNPSPPPPPDRIAQSATSGSLTDSGVTAAVEDPAHPVDPRKVARKPLRIVLKPNVDRHLATPHAAFAKPSFRPRDDGTAAARDVDEAVPAETVGMNASSR
jgi:hypothetical protein